MKTWLRRSVIGPMIGVKICGFTNVPDAVAAADAGADAIGLNFFAGSKRRVDLATAQAIAAAVARRVTLVGVFVNHSASEILALASRVPLDVVQLHGDEPPSIGAALSAAADPRNREIVGGGVLGAGARAPAVWRAVRCRDLAATATAVAWVEAYQAAAGRPLDALLVDAYDPGEYGGTGKRADLTVFATLCEQLPRLPIWLAGGLTPENVAAAVASAHPAGVDTASGVEIAPGVKDADRMRRFVAAARSA
jgi:phosphoribosylanthranilate isomerase